VGAAKALDKDPRRMRIDDWSRDGPYIILESPDPKTAADIWVAPQFGDKKFFAYLNSEYAEQNAKLSPNGQWIAYESNESKRFEINVQTFPEHGGKWQISTSGGYSPVWSPRRARAVLHRGGSQDDGGGGKAKESLQASVPKPLFEVAALATLDVSKDGRFLIQVPVEQAAKNVPLTVELNWQAGLKK
jgi:hypothetical protein